MYNIWTFRDKKIGFLNEHTKYADIQGEGSRRLLILWKVSTKTGMCLFLVLWGTLPSKPAECLATSMLYSNSKCLYILFTFPHVYDSLLKSPSSNSNLKDISGPGYFDHGSYFPTFLCISLLFAKFKKIYKKEQKMRQSTSKSAKHSLVTEKDNPMIQGDELKTWSDGRVKTHLQLSMVSFTVFSSQTTLSLCFHPENSDIIKEREPKT